jgi:hypothetical protein
MVMLFKQQIEFVCHVDDPTRRFLRYNDIRKESFYRSDERVKNGITTLVQARQKTFKEWMECR